MRCEHSKELFMKAKKLIPGGVNSPVRACSSVGATPVFMKSGQGSKMTCTSGDEFIDYVGSWGPLILGHRHPEVVQAVEIALAGGSSFGTPTELEIDLAELVCEAVSSVEMVRMVNSGTEATMSAVRVARGATGRDMVVKFDGCYHGHADSLLVAAGSGVATLGIPGSPGIPRATAEMTLSLPYNDLESVENVFRQRGGEIACVILEPVGGNMGVVPPEPGFLEGLRKITEEHGALLIFDEVMTGFRVAYGCAQERFDVRPDLTCLGKIIGGGLPVGAYGGRRDLMEHVAPAGNVYQAGTLSGNPLAMAAGIATLRALQQPGVYEELEDLSAALENGLLAAAGAAGLKACINRVGSMMTLFFTDGPVKNFEDAKTSDTEKFGRWWQAMANRGHYLPPSQFEAVFMSAAHTREDVKSTVDAATEALKLL
ncbi:MAG: glutamate-1-semialdehyde 2,1-aminomutase [Desulfatibacillaceae bacterium]